MWIDVWFLRRWSHILLLGMESYACLKSLKAVCSRDEPLRIFCAASLRCRRINSGCSEGLQGFTKKLWPSDLSSVRSATASLNQV